MPRPDAPAPPAPAPGPMLAAMLAGDAFDGDDEPFRRRVETLRRELAATTALETILVALILEAVERLRRAHRMREEIDAGDKNWTRYRNMAERSFWKALTSLQRGRRPARRTAEPPVGPAVPAPPT